MPPAGYSRIASCHSYSTICWAATACSPSPAWVARLQTLAAQVPGITEAIATVDAPAGSEDATLMMARVQAGGGQASYMIFGTELAAGHHHEKFDFDEATLSAAVETLTRIALSAGEP